MTAKQTSVEILGTKYDILISNEDNDKNLVSTDGYCDNTIHKICVDEMLPTERSKADLQAYQNKVLRHELIHAFLFESGLEANSDWAQCEEMVDWFACQFPKIQKVFEKLNI